MSNDHFNDEDFVNAWRFMSESGSDNGSHMTMKGVKRLIGMLDKAEAALKTERDARQIAEQALDGRAYHLDLACEERNRAEKERDKALSEIERLNGGPFHKNHEGDCLPGCTIGDDKRAETTCHEETWSIKLNKYQRDNLLWLMLQIWRGDYPELNTGDWCGEIPSVLGGGSGELSANDRPNVPLPPPKTHPASCPNCVTYQEALRSVVAQTHSWVITRESAHFIKPLMDDIRKIAKEAIAATCNHREWIKSTDGPRQCAGCGKLEQSAKDNKQS